MKSKLFSRLLPFALLTGLVSGIAGCDSSAEETSELPDGVWQSRGYGWIWEVDGDDIDAYNIAGDYCIESEELAEDVEDEDLRILTGSGDDSFRVFTDDRTYAYTFDRLPRLPDICDEDPDDSPEGVLDAVDALFTTHYAFFKEHGVDWPSGVEEARERIDSDTGKRQLFEILARLIAPIKDGHVLLRARFGGSRVEFDPGDGPTFKALDAIARRAGRETEAVRGEWYRAYRKKGINRVLLRGKARKRAQGSVVYGMVDDRVGYINFLSLEDLHDDYDKEEKVLHKTLDEAFEEFGSAEAVIIDLTVNTGGYDFLANAVASRFAAETTLAYTKRPGDSQSVDAQKVMIEPSERTRFTGPVYVLTSDVTVSAAEVLTLSLRALPNVTHVGMPTRGSFSDLLWKLLPNDWELSLSNEIYRDSEGRLWEAKGIRPDVELEVFNPADPTQGHVEAVRSVAAMAGRS